MKVQDGGSEANSLRSIKSPKITNFRPSKGSSLNPALHSDGGVRANDYSLVFIHKMWGGSDV